MIWFKIEKQKVPADHHSGEEDNGITKAITKDKREVYNRSNDRIESYLLIHFKVCSFMEYVLLINNVILTFTVHSLKGLIKYLI